MRETTIDSEAVKEIASDEVSGKLAPRNDLDDTKTSLTQALELIPQPKAWCLDRHSEPTKLLLLTPGMLYALCMKEQRLWTESFPVSRGEVVAIKVVLGPRTAREQGGVREREWSFDLGEAGTVEIVGQEVAATSSRDEVEKFARKLAQELGWAGLEDEA